MESAMACAKLTIGVHHSDIALASKQQPYCPRRTLILKHSSRVGVLDSNAVHCNGVLNHSYSRKFAGARSCLPSSPSPSGDTQADETGAVSGEKDGKDERKKKLSSQSSWEAKDVLGNDYLYRLGKEADNMNITVGAKGGMIDSLFAGDFLGKEGESTCFTAAIARNSWFQEKPFSASSIARNSRLHDESISASSRAHNSWLQFPSLCIFCEECEP